jgi:ribose-phosphate pyrophosphokinase
MFSTRFIRSSQVLKQFKPSSSPSHSSFYQFLHNEVGSKANHNNSYNHGSTNKSSNFFHRFRSKFSVAASILAVAAGSSVLLYCGGQNVSTKKWHLYTGINPDNKMPDLMLFTGDGNPKLAQEISKYLGIPLSKAKVSQFADGECAIQILENVREKHCFVIQPCSFPNANDQLVELLLLISTLRRSSAAEITAVIPFYPYSRADRKLASRIPISAADVALMLEEMGVDRVVAVDLHSGQIAGFFSPNTPVENLDSYAIGALYFSEKELIRPVIVSPSAGGVFRAKRFRSILMSHGHDDCDLALLIESKDADNSGRLHDSSAAGGEVNEIPADSCAVSNATNFPRDGFAAESARLDIVGAVNDCDCIIVEDICDTAKTMERAARELKKHGARNVYAFASHGLLSGKAAQRIERSELAEFVTTNSIPIAVSSASVQKITQLTVAPLIAEAIRRIYQNQSISDLFAIKLTIPEGDQPNQGEKGEVQLAKAADSSSENVIKFRKPSN